MGDKTIITLNIGEIKALCEFPSIEVHIDQLIRAFAGLLVTQTYPMELVINSFENYVLDNKLNKENNED